MNGYTLRPYARMILLIVLRHWQEPLTTEQVIDELRGMGFTGMALWPERVEIVVSELTRRIWHLDFIQEVEE